MPRFTPFRALRYARPNLDDLVAPPYDVIDDAGRQALIERHPANAVRIDFPRRDVAGPVNGYQEAAELLRAWRSGGTIRLDATPTFSIYRMTAIDSHGRMRRTTGVLGALTLEEPGTGTILPHEETTSKDKADRLTLLRATGVNTSPIWGLSMAEGLASTYRPDGPPDASATDGDGVLHELWVLRDPARLTAITEYVATAPVVIADGHHRFETALAYQHETSHPGADALLCYLVELAADELEVRPIHRIVTTDPDCDALAALEPWFEAGEEVEIDSTDDVATVAMLEENQALACLSGSSVRLLRPRAGVFATDVTLDSQRVRIALDALQPTPIHGVRFHHSVATVATAARTRTDGSGSTYFGLLLRPASVAQIRAVAERRSRMPAKTTFFWPKPRSGMVFRPLEP